MKVEIEGLSILLENEALRVRYGNLLNATHLEESGIVEFRLRMPDGSWSEDQAEGLLDCSAYRGKLERVELVHQDPESATVRMMASPIPEKASSRQLVWEATLFAQHPVLLIAYYDWWVNTVDLASPGGEKGPDRQTVTAFHGSELWHRPMKSHPASFFNSYAPDIGQEGIMAPDTPGPLDYNGHFVMAVTGRNGNGFGRVAPVASTDIVKLLYEAGFELFPYFDRPRLGPYSTFFFGVTGGPKAGLELGRRLVDGLLGGVPKLPECPKEKPVVVPRFQDFPAHQEFVLDPVGVPREGAIVEVCLDLQGADWKSVRVAEVLPGGELAPVQGHQWSQDRLYVSFTGSCERKYRVALAPESARIPFEVRPVMVDSYENIGVVAGQKAAMVKTPSATWVYHLMGGGFASLIDREGNDWISHKPGGGSAGEYRGIPNLGMGFHPGYPTITQGVPEGFPLHSELEVTGPLHARIRSASQEDQWSCMWDFFPTHADLTIERTGSPFWFLYEGTIGGKIELALDDLLFPNGTELPITERWEGNFSEKAWVAFRKRGLERSLVLVWHNPDPSVPCQFWQMEANMTVFGFGRSLSTGETFYLSQTPARFSVALVESRDPVKISGFAESLLSPVVARIKPKA